MRMYRDVRGPGTSSGVTFLNEYVLPLARFVIAAVDQAVRAFGPDALVVDQHALAGALVAFRHGLPWASLLPSSMALGHHRPQEVDLWAKGPLAGYCAEAGLPDIDPLSAMYSPHLQVAFTTTALTGPVELPAHAVLVGPALGERPDEARFPMEWLDPARRHVLVTVGTLNVDVAADFYRRAVDALDGGRWQGIVVAPDGMVADVPEHVRVLPRVPVLDLLPRLDAVRHARRHEHRVRGGAARRPAGARADHAGPAGHRRAGGARRGRGPGRLRHRHPGRAARRAGGGPGRPVLRRRLPADRRLVPGRGRRRRRGSVTWRGLPDDAAAIPVPLPAAGRAREPDQRGGGRARRHGATRSPGWARNRSCGPRWVRTRRSTRPGRGCTGARCATGP